ncbi:hypothetical protein [Flavonifractor hominis]|uniref:Uncharacterized protein n=1 Tax=Flavonifractor hominis TaxID=3133178 RepID=A0ABV1EMR5_9FIRM
MSGAISVIPIVNNSAPAVAKFAAASVIGALGNMAVQFIAVEINSERDVVEVITVGTAAGMLGEAAANVLIKAFQAHFATLTRTQQKSLLNHIWNITNHELTIIRKTIKMGSRQ